MCFSAFLAFHHTLQRREPMCFLFASPPSGPPQAVYSLNAVGSRLGSYAVENLMANFPLQNSVVASPSRLYTHTVYVNMWHIWTLRNPTNSITGMDWQVWSHHLVHLSPIGGLWQSNRLSIWQPEPLTCRTKIEQDPYQLFVGMPQSCDVINRFRDIVLTCFMIESLCFLFIGWHWSQRWAFTIKSDRCSR